MVAANYIIGGLMAGGGQAIQQDGIARRDAFYRELDNLRADRRAQMGEDRADQRQKGSQDFAASQTDKEISARTSAADRESEGIKSTITRIDPKDRKPHIVGLDKKGNEIKDYGVAPEAKGNSAMRLVPIDDGNGGTILVTPEEAYGQSPPKTKDQRTEDEAASADAEQAALDQATEEADAKASLWNSDATDFAADGGSREAFIKRRQQELLKDPNTTDSKAGAKPAASEAPAAKPKAAEKNVDGTDNTLPALTGEDTSGGKKVAVPGMGGATQDVKSLPMLPKGGGVDVKRLVVGGVYKSPSGVVARWTGEGFEPIN